MIEAQRRELEAQRERLAEQELRLAELERRLGELAAVEAEAAAAGEVEQRLAEVEQTVQRVPEMAVENLQGDFPRSIRIPGTDAALRVGGRVRSVFVQSFDAIGSDDRFVTSSIPLAGSEEAGKSSRVELSVIPSRFNLDLRTPTGLGHMRAFIEGDFAGGDDRFRLRHSFGEWRGWMVGQTWSTFSDPEAEPDGIDFEGLNAISLFRQPQVRWTRAVAERLDLAVALEEANPDLTGATGVNQVPDLVVRLRWEPDRARLQHGLFAEGSHVQAAFLLRQLRGEVEGGGGTLATEGFGVNVSGVVPAPWARDTDRFRFAWNAGEGIGRYLTDLDSAGGQDAVYDAERNELDALPAVATYLGYEHWWRPDLRSTVTLGLVWVENLDTQPADALHRTERASVNLAWSPIPRLDLVAELLWGRKFVRDGGSGEARQLQLGSSFRF